MSYSTVRRVRLPASPSGGRGDRIARQARPQLLALSRQLYRDSVIYRGLVDRIAECVGSGWQLQARDVDDARAAALEAAARGWAAACGSAGEPLDDLLRLLAREWILTGEAWAVWTSAGVQVIESETVDDVDRDAGGALRAARVVEPAGPRDLPADACAWIIDVDQPSARRGVPLLQAAFPVIAQVQDVLESEARSWRIQSKLVLTILSQDAGATMGEADADGVEVIEDDLSYIWQARPGDALQAIERTTPAKNFTEGLRSYLRVIGQSIGLPLEVVLLDWTQSNYSQARAALAATNSWFDRRRARFARLIARVVSWGIPAAWDPVAPALPWTDPQAEAETAAARLDRGLSTYSDEIRRAGADPDEHRRRIAADIESAIALAREIEDRTGVVVPWEHLAGYAPGKTALAAREAGAKETGR